MGLLSADHGLLNNVADIVQECSSRVGNLAFTRERNSTTIELPLNTSDILILSFTKLAS